LTAISSFNGDPSAHTFARKDEKALGEALFLGKFMASTLGIVTTLLLLLAIPCSRFMESGIPLGVTFLLLPRR